MIEKWFKSEIEELLKRNGRVVVSDGNGDGAFLMDCLKGVAIVMTAGSTIDEIKCRYEAEKHHKDENVVFYVTIPIANMSFLLDYAKTGGMVDLTNIGDYTRQQLFSHTATNATISDEDLVLAAKLGAGKDENWWKGVAKGVTKPFDIESMTISLLCEPNGFMDSLDDTVKKLFTKELYKLIGKTETNQTNEALAQEVAKSIIDALVENNIGKQLYNIYKRITDMTSAKEAVGKYIAEYKLPSDASPLTAHKDHPLELLDRKMVEWLSKDIESGNDTSAYLHAINQRLESKVAQGYKATWLKDIATLLSASWTKVYDINTIEQYCSRYQSELALLDNAMRHIYGAWLNKQEVLRPIQYLYEQRSKEWMEKWFDLAANYKPTQKDAVAEALTEKGRIAVIVGDGLRLEIANEVAECLSKDLESKGMLLAMLPSVTENGMSALYGCDGVELTAQNRFAKLKEKIANVNVMALDDLNDSVDDEKLVLTFGDIDQVGEKKQLAGLKDISAYPAILSNTIRQLLAKGYDKVYITADHGFVITGILDDSDKVKVPSGQDMKVNERFILSNDKLHEDNLVERTDSFGDYAYQYYAKTDKPFVSRGLYGYAHGGLSPQECIVPMYCFKGVKGNTECEITISNKKDLKSVTGNSFVVKMEAKGDHGNMFETSRKVKVQLFSQTGKQLTSVIKTVNVGNTEELELEMGESPCKLVVTDNATTEQLDSCMVESSGARDLGGLF